ncbi:hypothetical protein [Sutcliffiella halmapala]|uniref:hypothetical protein n=1 Tax=Sutcliffiella halmapala TaxID=79882 RepID=UPI00099557FE|nr:hypothetical protein [Sutcliffiella halmapala]
MFKDSTMNQVILPLDLEMKLQENDVAYAVHDLVEQIPEIKWETPEALSTEELSEIAAKLEDKIECLNQKIESCEDVQERKQLRSARKETSKLLPRNYFTIPCGNSRYLPHHF